MSRTGGALQHCGNEEQAQLDAHNPCNDVSRFLALLQEIFEDYNERNTPTALTTAPVEADLIPELELEWLGISQGGRTHTQ